ncbi:MAG: ABC transporter permease subunit [Gemmiger sp.]|nr:ABC transporter permease subunit [Gemmiger sp.]
MSDKTSAAGIVGAKKRKQKEPQLLQPKKSFWQTLWRQRSILLLALPGVVLLIIFRYVPMYGILIAFKNYKAAHGVWGSAWLDPLWKNFAMFFKNVNCWPIIWNTLKVGVLSLLFTFPAPIIFAILLNETKGRLFKKGAQTISYIPHFISVVVICSMLNGFGSTTGLFNDLREIMGFARVDMNYGDQYFLLEYIGSAVWQGMGWGSIIYLAALSNVDTTLYDVANIDGANRWQKIKNIAWPTILPTAAIMLIMNVGNVLNADFTKILLMQNDTNRSSLDVIATFVYQKGIVEGKFSYSTAVNLFASIISFILVYGANAFTRKINPENSLW